SEPLFVRRSLRFLTTLPHASDIDGIQHQVVLVSLERDRMAASVHFMLAVRPVPFCNAGCLVHVLDDLSPADSGVVSVERDLTELGRVRNDAHFSPTEVVVEEVLKPHSRNEQEVPWIVAALLDVFHRSVARNLSVTFSRQTKGLVELLHDVHQSQAW